MRRLYPEVTEEALEDVYADLGEGRSSWVAIGMVSSLDGAATLEGVSGGLGQEGDLAAFRALRAACDVILVGAGTVRAEGYGPARVRPADRDRRVARGQAPRPAVAVVSGSLDLTGAERLWEEDPDWRPVVITHDGADAARTEELRRRDIEVMVAGQGEVDLRTAVEQLRARGLVRILCEGGPRLNGQLLAAELIDEVFVTIAPALLGGPAGRIVTGSDATPTTLDLVDVRQHANEVLLRYRVAR